VTASIGAVSVPRYARNADEAINRARKPSTWRSAGARGHSGVAAEVERDAQRRGQYPRHRRDRHRAQRAPDREAFEPVVDARSREPRSMNAWFACNRTTASFCWRLISCRGEKLGLIGWSITACSNWWSQNLQRRERAAQPHTRRTPRWIRTVGRNRIADARASRRRRAADREITETVAIQDIDDVRGFVTRLKISAAESRSTISARLHLVRKLRKLGVDIVKIDGAFVQNTRDRPTTAPSCRPDRSGAPAGIKPSPNGAGRGIGVDAARLGLRLHPGRLIASPHRTGRAVAGCSDGMPAAG